MSPLDDDFFKSIPARDAVIGTAVIAVPIATLVMLGLLFLRPKPIERSAVIGCYVANGAPNLEVGANFILIHEAQHRSFTYVVEPFKRGYHFAVNPALGLRSINSGKFEFFPEKGSGYFWPLLSAKSDDPRNVREPSDFGGRFQIIAQGGQPVIYRRETMGGRCD